MPVRRGLPPVTAFSDANLRVTRSGQVSVDYPESHTLLYFITTYAAEASRHNPKSLAELYRSERDPGIDSWKVDRYAGFSAPKELRWEARGSSRAGPVSIDRYVLYHSIYLEIPLLHFHSQGGHSKGAVLWFRLEGKASQRDWPQIANLLSEGYEVFSFDFRGLGETRMNFRLDSEDTRDMTQDNVDAAYMNPLMSVFADYVYNSLLIGRPYFLEMMDDLKIVELFVRSLDSHGSRESLTLDAPGEAYSLAIRFQEVDPEVKLLTPESAPVLDWSRLAAQGQEQWPIAFLMPDGATITAKSE
jgi:hypothetical protein